MLVQNLAIVSNTSEVDAADLTVVAAAIQLQITRDLSPIWGINATVSAFASVDDVPVGHWPLFIVDESESRHGVNQDERGQPFAVINAGDGWSIDASHEALEMLVDPSGNRLVPGQSVDPTQGRVEYLVEVCDPCEAGELAYTINGVRVSDFYTPNYFDPVASRGVRYSHTGALRNPLDVLSGGYLTWREPTSGVWFQQRFVDTDAPVIVQIGSLEPSLASLRARIDRKSVDARKTWRRAAKGYKHGSKRPVSGPCIDASKAQADFWRNAILLRPRS